MELVYQTTFPISAYAVDCHGRLKLSSILYFAQEAAGRHCNLLGVDTPVLAQKNLFWAVTRHKVVIHRLPEKGETISLHTWPMPTSRVAYPRSFAAYDEKGELLFQGISIWILMDISSRKMVLPGKSGIAVEGISLGNELELPRSIMPTQHQQHVTRSVTYSCLDRNGHMNNTRYLDWVDDLLSADYHKDNQAKSFSVCYFSEGKETQQIQLHWTLDADKCLHTDAQRNTSETDSTPLPVFSAKVQF